MTDKDSEWWVPLAFAAVVLTAVFFLWIRPIWKECRADGKSVMYCIQLVN